MVYSLANRWSNFPRPFIVLLCNVVVPSVSRKGVLTPTSDVTERDRGHLHRGLQISFLLLTLSSQHSLLSFSFSPPFGELAWPRDSRRLIIHLSGAVAD